jgi:hypothetical protein
MFLKRRLVVFASVTAALAAALPVAFASAATVPASNPVVTGPSCPAGYTGPTNPATGCPYYTMAYTVTYPGQAPYSCPLIFSLPPSWLGAGALARVVSVGSAVPAPDPCSAVSPGN